MAAIALPSLALIACGGAGTAENVDIEQAEQEFRRSLEARYGTPVEGVECPERRIREGDVFTCTAGIGGQSLRLTVTQTDDEGALAYEPAQAVISVEKATSGIAASIREQTGVPYTVECGAEGVLVKDVGAEFECQATPPRAPARVVVVTVADIEGNVGFRLL